MQHAEIYVTLFSTCRDLRHFVSVEHQWWIELIVLHKLIHSHENLAMRMQLSSKWTYHPLYASCQADTKSNCHPGGARAVERRGLNPSPPAGTNAFAKPDVSKVKMDWCFQSQNVVPQTHGRGYVLLHACVFVYIHVNYIYSYTHHMIWSCNFMCAKQPYSVS